MEKEKRKKEKKEDTPQNRGVKMGLLNNSKILYSLPLLYISISPLPFPSPPPHPRTPHSPSKKNLTSPFNFYPHSPHILLISHPLSSSYHSSTTYMPPLPPPPNTIRTHLHSINPPSRKQFDIAMNPTLLGKYILYKGVILIPSVSKLICRNLEGRISLRGTIAERRDVES